MRSPWIPKLDPIDMDAMPEVVVLVPTWNEATVIERRLTNLAAQRIEGQNLREAGVGLMLIDSGVRRRHARDG